VKVARSQENLIIIAEFIQRHLFTQLRVPPTTKIQIEHEDGELKSEDIPNQKASHETGYLNFKNT
jgi:hypothetical protein